MLQKLLKQKSKIRMLLLLSIVFFSSCSSSECNDEKACTFFTEQMNVIEASIKGDDSLNVESINTAILNLEEITNITSSSDGNYLGRFNPSKKDFKNWRDWYKSNKHRLYWDDKEKKVKLN